jgi:hypothetical protein
MYRKNPTTLAGFDPANSGTRGQHANHQTTDAAFLLGNSLASEFYMPMLWNTVCSIFILAREGGTECSETLAYKIQMPGNYPEESIQHFTILFFILICFLCCS